MKFGDLLAELAPPGRIYRNVQRLTSFSEDIIQAGRKPSARPLSIKNVRPKKVCQLLRQKTVLELRRLRFADKNPVCIEVTYLPLRFSRILSKENLCGSLYEHLGKSGEHLKMSEELLMVRRATNYEQSLFRMPSTVPVVEIFRLALNDAGQPAELTRNVLRGDRYLFHFKLKRHDGRER